MSDATPGRVSSPGYVRTGAQISDDGLFRYDLLRWWAEPGVNGARALRFVMLNPSTADADQDDPTIRRCVGFAKREGYAGAIIVNLYAFRATDPKDLAAAGYPVGPHNRAILSNHLYDSRMGGHPVVAAWGVNARPDRVRDVLSLVPGVDWRCLGTTKDGHPRHPLYVRGDQPLDVFGGVHV